MIHTYSLIHDDLPSIDNDDLRRGKPTCHKVFGEATAILAGGRPAHRGLQGYVRSPLDRSDKPTDRQPDDLRTATAAGAEGMVAGQIMDVFYEAKRAQDDPQLHPCPQDHGIDTSLRADRRDYGGRKGERTEKIDPVRRIYWPRIPDHG